MKLRAKHSLLISVLSLVLCCAMLAGTTFAWFTDEVSGTGNKIKTGTLKVDLLVTDGDETVSLKDDPSYPVFSYENWEPGYTAVAPLTVVNEGSLAFKYKMNLTAAVSDYTEDYKLAEVIEVYVADGVVEDAESIADIKADNSGWTKIGMLSDYMNVPGEYLVEGYILAGEDANESYTIALHMLEEAGNEYQDMTLGNIYMTLEAAQYTYESDAFDDQYDAAAEYNSNDWVVVRDGEGFAVEEDMMIDTALVQMIGVVNDPYGQYKTAYGVSTNDELAQYVVSNDVTIDGQGNTVTFIPAKDGTRASTHLGVAEGYTATLKNITLAGEYNSLAVGTYHSGWGKDYNAVLENVNIVGVEADYDLTIPVGALTIYADTTLNNCVVKNTTDVSGDYVTEWYPEKHQLHDVLIFNDSDTIINGGEYGAIYAWTQTSLTINGAKVDTLTTAIAENTRYSEKNPTYKWACVIGAGSEVGVIDMVGTNSSAMVENLKIEAGATVGTLNIPSNVDIAHVVIDADAEIGAINYKGNTYTVAEFNNLK